MANLSDACGTITVKKVGKEFIKFVETVQGGPEGAYYLLVDREDILEPKIDAEGDLKMAFDTYGRWTYQSNVDGYLGGEWMKEEKSAKAYKKFTDALIEKEGSVEVEYSDEEGGNGFKGQGHARLYSEHGEIKYQSTFEEE